MTSLISSERKIINMIENKNFIYVIKYLSVFLYMIGIITLIPLILIVFYPQELNYAINFIIPGVSSVFVGFLLYLLTKDYQTQKLSKNQNNQLVFLIWIVAIIVSSIPFLMTGKYDLTQALFESTSGYSTTGLSVVDVSTTAHILLFHRSFMQFIGGVGLVLVVTFTFANKYGVSLYSSEGHTDNIVPNLVKSARVVFSLYTVAIILGVIGYTLFGMPVFDAINHSIAAVSTGGFSVQPLSIGYYQSIPIEIITMTLMIFGSTNFVVHLLIIKQKYKKALSHSENISFIVIMIGFIGVLFVSLLGNINQLESFRISIFQTISSLTTTGYTTLESFSIMPDSFVFAIIILMIIGGSTGSTAGGLKQYRLILMYHDIRLGLYNKLNDPRVFCDKTINRFGNRIIIEQQEIKDNYRFVILYLTTLLIGAFVITFFGYSLRDSLFEVASALGTVGHSIGVMTFASHPVVLWVGIVAMLLGRLEFYVVITAIGSLILGLKRK